MNFDCSGLVYGVHAHNTKTSHHTIRLYDARFTSEPFQDISPVDELYKAALSQEGIGMGMSADTLERVFKAEWHAFNFSNEGNHLLCNTDTEVLWMLDGFRPDVTPVPILTRRNEYGNKLGACYSTDDRYIFTGKFVYVCACMYWYVWVYVGVYIYMCVYLCLRMYYMFMYVWLYICA
ncbi:hypothetical protein EON63_11500 [archaeon]|nr:MAG: hypothetical protein EON63_11500 [archaeon]